eukprot:49945-Eustigmatos_ZCMA.PRE.1
MCDSAPNVTASLHAHTSHARTPSPTLTSLNDLALVTSTARPTRMNVYAEEMAENVNSAYAGMYP